MPGPVNIQKYSLDGLEYSVDLPHRDLDWINHPLNKALSGYWPLRRHFNIGGVVKAFDYSGRQNHLLVMGAIVKDDPQMGKSTQFDVIDDYLQTDSSSVGDITTQDFSFVGMFKRTSADAVNRYILDKFVTGGNGYDMFFLTNMVTLRINLRNNDQTNIVTFDVNMGFFYPGTNYIGKWFAFGLSASRASNGNFWLYEFQTGKFARVTKSLAPIMGLTLSNTANLTIGKSSNSFSNFFPGMISEVRFYDSLAITEAQFLELVKLMAKRL